jgi:hypothetical protein
MIFVRFNDVAFGCDVRCSFRQDSSDAVIRQSLTIFAVLTVFQP